MVLSIAFLHDSHILSFAAQKFRFCGDLDAPDWILAEITVLSKMVRVDSCCSLLTMASQSSVRMKLLARQILSYLLGREFNVISGFSGFAIVLIRALVVCENQGAHYKRSNELW